MKVLEILTKDQPKEFCDYTLQKSIINDYLFDHFNYTIVIKSGDKVDFLYRCLWETTYLRVGESYYDDRTELMYITISLSEAIGFIKQTTPPLLQNKIPESIKSVDSIKEILQQFLMDNNSGALPYYLNEFKRYTKFNRFETIMNYDKSRMSILRNHLKTKCVLSEIMISDKPISDIIGIQSKPVYNAKMQIMFHAENEEDLTELLETFAEIKICGGKVKIININTEDKSTFVEAYIDAYYNESMTMLGDIIERTYENL